MGIELRLNVNEEDIRAKAMYHLETSVEFLQHVKASALEQHYDLGMLAAAHSIVPKTL